MNTEEIVRIVLSAAAGLGMGTLLNSWLTRRWESQQEVSRAIGNIAGQLVGIVGSAKDQVAENEVILAQVRRGELSPDRARAKLREQQIEIGSMIMGIQIICEAVSIEVQPLLAALEEFRLSAMEVMREQAKTLEGEAPEGQYDNIALMMRLSEKERSLISASVTFIKVIKHAKF